MEATWQDVTKDVNKCPQQQQQPERRAEIIARYHAHHFTNYSYSCTPDVPIMMAA